MSAADDRGVREAFIAHVATDGVTGVTWADGLGPVGYRGGYGAMLGTEWARFAAGYAAAIAAEREAAAKVCEAAQDGMDDSPGSIGAWCRTTLNRVAAAIRARGAS